MRVPRFLVWVTLVCATAPPVVTGQDRREPVRPTSVPGEFVVKLKPSVNVGAVGAAIAGSAQGSTQVVRQFEFFNAMQIRIPEELVGTEAQVQLQRNLAGNPAVEIVEPNYLYYQDLESPPDRSEVPDDPSFDDLWYMNTIRAVDAWGTRRDSPDVIVAVIDTGVFLDHEDLVGSIWHNDGETPNNGQDDDGNGFVDDVVGWDFFNDDNDPSPDLVPVDILPGFCIPHSERKIYEAHGTHVAGTIGAVGDNAVGITGVSWRVKIMPLKFLGGTCGNGNLADAIAAMDYAVGNGARIINCSWGGGAESELLKDAIESAHNAGVLVVTAAGNGGSDGAGDDNDSFPHFPSSYDVPNVIAVAASGEDDRLTDFSNFGDRSVDLAAPGRAILSTVPSGDENSDHPRSDYEAFNGTSMATPIVSGALALITAQYPGMAHLEAKDILFRAVDTVASLDGKLATGGRLNIANALRPETPPSFLTGVEKLSPEDREALGKHLAARRLPPYVQTPFRPTKDDRTPTAPVRLEIVVDLSRQLTIEELAKQLAPLRIDKTKLASSARNVYLVILATESSAEDVLNTMRRMPGVEKAEINAVYRKE